MAETVHPPGSLHMGNVADDLATRAGPLHVVVVSPARPIFEGDARFVTVAALEGQMGVWPRHADLVAALGTGRLRIGRAGDGEARFAISGGFIKVGDARVTILVDRAVAAEDVDAAQAQADLDEAKAALRHPATDEEFEKLLTARRWAQTRIRLAQR